MTCLRNFPVPPSSCRQTLKLALHAPETLTMSAAWRLAELKCEPPARSLAKKLG